MRTVGSSSAVGDVDARLGSRRAPRGARAPHSSSGAGTDGPRPPGANSTGTGPRRRRGPAGGGPPVVVVRVVVVMVVVVVPHRHGRRPAVAVAGRARGKVRARVGSGPAVGGGGGAALLRPHVLLPKPPPVCSAPLRANSPQPPQIDFLIIKGLQAAPWGLVPDL